MAATSTRPFAAELLPGRVSARTLTLTRWLAIGGQAAALVVVHYILGFALPIGTAMAVVAASAALNVAVSLRPPGPAGLSERQAVLFLAFDILQLSVLLYLTGGLTNPFSLLIVAPVTVSATILTRRSTMALCVLAIACASFLAAFHEPLPVGGPGGAVELPSIFRLGTWVAVVIGIVFLAAYAGIVAAERRRMHAALAAAQAALSGEQRLSSLGALAAAAAHELGSPLSTIAVTVNEIAREAPPDGPWAEDLAILREEIERCRTILADLGRAPETDDQSPFIRQPLTAFVRAAADAQRHDGVELMFPAGSEDTSPEPMVLRRPEYIYGLASLIQNACQFARREVVIEARWTAAEVAITIRDDGPGFPPALLDRLGEPYISSRAHTGDHMGLGIFIARNLLQQTGGSLDFSNIAGGARVDIAWPRTAIEGADPTA